MLGIEGHEVANVNKVCQQVNFYLHEYMKM